MPGLDKECNEANNAALECVIAGDPILVPFSLRTRALASVPEKAPDHGAIDVGKADAFTVQPNNEVLYRAAHRADCPVGSTLASKPFGEIVEKRVEVFCPGQGRDFSPS
ncbi:hypothetical protein HY30_18885 [Hyphomonas chukchiensis]|jgi:hypothetical protein|uniref:Uncharacterized protein n=1 Tax=Hyphomonas chukchiensis TaxID=1280947 RepID=A0A062UDG7_9PROT|nr:hypothetical protein HY30_18885 [Hyphomonas chukchiensis]|tara:strand:+ start:489 stop:815 length:327 start_codon:yes stop_codon:yes gene_type:complete